MTTTTHFNDEQEKTALRRFNTQRVVVKIGSALLTANGRGLDKQAITQWGRQLAQLAVQGCQIVLVSSGAVAEGMARLQLHQRPTSLNELQACAAIGQMGLIEVWSNALLEYQIHSAQILLTHDDLANRARYLNAGSTLSQLIEWGVIPVINENDTVATDEIRFGDNDTLAAMVAALVNADLLVILTDQEGMFDKNPSLYDDAKLLSEVRALDDHLFDMAGGSGKFGRGGMITKVNAARLAARSGCPTIVARGTNCNVLLDIMEKQDVGTFFTVDQDRLSARKLWLAAHMQTAGRLHIDAGAVIAIIERKKSLLPVGVTRVEGEFEVGDVVECVGVNGQRVAVGIVSYSADQARQIIGLGSDEVTRVLGENTPNTMMHRDYLTLV